MATKLKSGEGAVIQRQSQNGCVGIEDLISIGTIGLIKAVNSYQPDKKIKLATYSARCIENEILMYFRSLRKQGTEVSLSDPIDSDKEGNPLSRELIEAIPMGVTAKITEKICEISGIEPIKTPQTSIMDNMESFPGLS